MTLPAESWTHPIHHRFPAITWATLAAEIDREAGARRSTYPPRVETGRMTQAEMEWQLQLVGAWREDVDRFRRSHAPLEQGQPAILLQRIPATHGIAWRPRRAAVLRELEQRRQFYPQWVEQSRITPAAAAARIDAFECLLALYEMGFDWIPANGTAAAWDRHPATPDQLATREEIKAVLAEIAGRSVVQQQELFA